MIEQNIILIGPPGSGKTVCGGQLARKLGLNFVDTDQLIEEKTGLTVPQIFQDRGEPHFRQLETELLCELIDKPGKNHVIASGGGLPATDGNFGRLLCLGTVVYLQTAEETLVERLDGGRGRPLLSVDPSDPGQLLNRIRSLRAAREAVYQQAPHHIDTTGLTPEQVVDEIIQLLGP